MTPEVRWLCCTGGRSCGHGREKPLMLSACAYGHQVQEAGLLLRRRSNLREEQMAHGLGQGPCPVESPAVHDRLVSHIPMYVRLCSPREAVPVSRLSELLYRPLSSR